jgi:pyruvate/2-oxoglutarate dehydrogenase complex dihydrolipoamide dehydrogenase (E3) component
MRPSWAGVLHIVPPMATVEHYSIMIVGSGQAGKYLAWTTAKAGHRTAVVERRWVGGSCPNVACLPSKNIIHSANVRSLAQRATDFGLELGAVATNMRAVQQRKRTMVEDFILGISTAIALAEPN